MVQNSSRKIICTSLDIIHAYDKVQRSHKALKSQKTHVSNLFIVT